MMFIHFLSPSACYVASEVMALKRSGVTHYYMLFVVDIIIHYALFIYAFFFFIKVTPFAHFFFASLPRCLRLSPILLTLAVIFVTMSLFLLIFYVHTLIRYDDDEGRDRVTRHDDIIAAMRR